MLPSDKDTTGVAEAAAEQARADGVRVSVIPTRSIVQTLAAVAVHDPSARFDDDVVAMTRAAGATRYAAVTVASRAALTTVGPCEVGDILGLVDGDIVAIGSDPAEVARDILGRMLAVGGELVTLVLGADAGPDLVDGLPEWLARDPAARRGRRSRRRPAAVADHHGRRVRAVLHDRLTSVVGGRTADALRKGLGLVTVEDLLRHYPRRYAERGELTDLSTLRGGGAGDGARRGAVGDGAADAQPSRQPARGRRHRRAGVHVPDVLQPAVAGGPAGRGPTGTVLRPGVALPLRQLQLTHPEFELLPEGVDDDPLAVLDVRRRADPHLPRREVRHLVAGAQGRRRRPGLPRRAARPDSRRRARRARPRRPVGRAVRGAPSDQPRATSTRAIGAAARSRRPSSCRCCWRSVGPEVMAPAGDPTGAEQQPAADRVRRPTAVRADRGPARRSRPASTRTWARTTRCTDCCRATSAAARRWSPCARCCASSTPADRRRCSRRPRCSPPSTTGPSRRCSARSPTAAGSGRRTRPPGVALLTGSQRTRPPAPGACSTS